MGATTGATVCPLPDGLRYDVENDVWLRLLPGGRRARLGLTAPIVSFAGKFSRVEFRVLDGAQPVGRSIATVESIRFVGPVRLPVPGEVVGRNPSIVERPKLLNDAPYDAGWVAEVETWSDAAALDGLVDAEEARRAYARRIADLRIHCLPAVPDAELYEIGAECSAILARLDETLAQRAVGDVLLLVTDDPTAPIEMVRWSDRTGHAVLHVEREGNLVKFLVRREANPEGPRRRR